MQSNLTPNFLCFTCGKAFHRPPSANAKYCSRPCYDAAQKTSLDDLMRLVDTSGGPDACWPWQGNVSRWGYGKATVNRHGTNAHRAVYEAIHGELPIKVVVRHTCDNRRCCNDAHLIAGTQKENIADQFARGRHRSQKRHAIPPPER